MLKAVLFDLDNTLVDEESAAVDACHAWAAEYGITGDDVSERWLALTHAIYQRHQRGELTYAEQRRERARAFLGSDLSDDDADDAFDRYQQRYNGTTWQAYDDVVPALTRVRAAGLVVGVLTNGRTENQDLKLGVAGLADLIDVPIATDRLPAGKPDPRSYAAALDIMGLSADTVLMVGDHPVNDYQGPLDAGLDAVLLDRYDRHVDSGARRIRTLTDLPLGAVHRRTAG